jgi:hypothetical protein
MGCGLSKVTWSTAATMIRAMSTTMVMRVNRRMAARGYQPDVDGR